jgi:hypothetical protein
VPPGAGGGVETVDAVAQRAAQLGRGLRARAGQAGGLHPGGQLLFHGLEEVDDGPGAGLVDLPAVQRRQRRGEPAGQRHRGADEIADPPFAVGVHHAQLAGQPLADVHDLRHRRAAVGGALRGEGGDQLGALRGQCRRPPLGQRDQPHHPEVRQVGPLLAARRAHGGRELVGGHRPHCGEQVLAGHRAPVVGEAAHGPERPVGALLGDFVHVFDTSRPIATGHGESTAQRLVHGCRCRPCSPRGGWDWSRRPRRQRGTAPECRAGAPPPSAEARRVAPPVRTSSVVA